MSTRERSNEELKAIFASMSKKGISSSQLNSESGVAVSFNEVPTTNRMLVEVPDKFNDPYDLVAKKKVNFVVGTAKLVKLKNDRIAIKGKSTATGNKVLRIIG